MAVIHTDICNDPYCTGQCADELTSDELALYSTWADELNQDIQKVSTVDVDDPDKENI